MSYGTLRRRSRSFKANLITSVTDWADLQVTSVDAIEQVKRSLEEAEVLDEGRYAAWGQYFDHSPRVDQKGIYGTSVAIQMFSRYGRPPTEQQRVLVKGGQRWLLEEWTTQDSRTSEKRDQAISYKHIWLVNAFTIPEDIKEYSEADRFCEHLWEKKVEWGWGEYWYSPSEPIENRTDEPKPLPTALTLHALARSKPSKYDEFHNSLHNLVNEMLFKARQYLTQDKGEVSRILLELSATVLAIYELDRQKSREFDPDLQESINNLLDMFSSVLDTIKSVDPEAYVFHQYTAPLPETRRSRFMVFLYRPIVAAALLATREGESLTSYLEYNWRFVIKSVEVYTEGINETDGVQKGNYRITHTGFASTGDHYWILRFLNDFADTAPESLQLRKLVFSELQEKLPVSLLFVLLFIVSAGIGGVLTLDDTLLIEIATGVILAVSSAIFAKFVEKLADLT